MNGIEYKIAKHNIDKYERLKALRDRVNRVLTAITEGWEHGPCRQGPFTGNTRESRDIDGLKIFFTHTKGGAESVTMDLDLGQCGVSAYEMGAFLRLKFEAQLKLIDEEMGKIGAPQA